MRPEQPAHLFPDPMEFAMTGFDACRLIRQAIRSNTVDRAHLEEVEEALKRLGWGRSSE